MFCGECLDVANYDKNGKHTFFVDPVPNLIGGKNKEQFIVHKQKRIANYKNDVLHGPYIYYDGYNRKRKEVNYFNGVLHGSCIYYENKDKKYYGLNYINGKFDENLWIGYYRNGKERIKFQDDLGICIEYYDDGKIKCKSLYKSKEDFPNIKMLCGEIEKEYLHRIDCYCMKSLSKKKYGNNMDRIMEVYYHKNYYNVNRNNKYYYKNKVILFF